MSLFWFVAVVLLNILDWPEICIAELQKKNQYVKLSYII